MHEETPWCLTAATVTDCRRTFATSMIDETAISDEGFALAEFTITFSYAANDPSNPRRNTASEMPHKLWTTVVVCIVAAVTALFLIWLSHRVE